MNAVNIGDAVCIHWSKFCIRHFVEDFNDEKNKR